MTNLAINQQQNIYEPNYKNETIDKIEKGEIEGTISYDPDYEEEMKHNLPDFLNSDKIYERSPEQDEFQYGNAKNFANTNQMVGASLKISPQEAHEWVNVVKDAAPLVAAFGLWISTQIDKLTSKNSTPQEKAVAAAQLKAVESTYLNQQDNAKEVA